MKTSSILKSSLAVSAAALTAKSANAAIVYSGEVDLFALNDVPVGFDLDDDGSDDFEFLFANNNQNKPSIRTTNFQNGGLNVVFAKNETHGLPVTPAGVSIDADFLAGLENTYDETWFYQQWEPADVVGDWYDAGATVTGYVGLAIPRGGDDYNFGWAQFSVNVDSKFMELHDFAYETELNTSILTAAVPEPTATALLVVGATGLLTLRKRRASRD